MANPIKKWGYVAQGRAAMRLLKNEILDKVLLRRTKVQCADVLALPPRYMSGGSVKICNCLRSIADVQRVLVRVVSRQCAWQHDGTAATRRPAQIGEALPA